MHFEFDCRSAHPKHTVIMADGATNNAGNAGNADISPNVVVDLTHSQEYSSPTLGNDLNCFLVNNGRTLCENGCATTLDHMRQRGLIVEKSTTDIISFTIMAKLLGKRMNVQRVQKSLRELDSQKERNHRFGYRRAISQDMDGNERQRG